MKHSRDEDIIRQKVGRSEAVNNESSVNTHLLWATLDAKINAKPVKDLRRTFYWAAAALLIIIIAVGIQAGKKDSVQIDKPIAKVLMQPAITPENNKSTQDQAKPSVVQQKIKHKRLVTVSHQYSDINTTPVSEIQMGKNNNDVRLNMENCSQLGLNATPFVTPVCYNTTIESNLLCYSK